MEKNYTEKALIRYIYKESDLFEKLEVEHAIEFEENIRSMYMEFCEVFDIIPEVQLLPSEKTIDRILNFSRTVAFQV